MPGALLTDLYELNMAASYLRRGMNDAATFSLFVRRLPPQRGFLVAAGLARCLAFLEALRFEEADLAYLGADLGFDAEALAEFRDLRFTGDVRAIPEGRIAFANEPLLEVTAPIAEAQLVETFLLNTVTFQTTVASKAARCVIAAQGRDLVDFSFRRTQGVDAAMDVARAATLVGFAATSNVEAARRHGLSVAGTMAHSYVEAFPTEVEAFRAFARDFPGRTTFLVDTYDTPAGVRTAIEVIRELGLAAPGADAAGRRGADGAGRSPLGIRIDSGDLGALAREARAILDDAGLPGVRILVSGGLDELDIQAIVRSGAPVDAFGVGTRMGVSADAPSVDSVYKLVEYAGRPVVKLSPAKVTAPGPKQVLRPAGTGGEADVVTLRDEPVPPGVDALLEPVMVGGRRLGPPPSLADGRARFEADLARLPADLRRLADPPWVEPAFSERATRLAEEVRLGLAGQGAG